MSIAIEIAWDGAGADGGFARLARLGADFAPVMSAIAGAMLTATRERFASRTDPDGNPWRPNRAGTRTLYMHGHLFGTLAAGSDAQTAWVGSNRVYAAVHQFGATIRPKTAKALHFATGDGGFATVGSVTIPARPYLGFGAVERADAAGLVAAAIKGALDGRSASPPTA
jgi:phage virion morphogenesis protein